MNTRETRGENAAVDALSLSAGTTIDCFEIRSVIGTGGFGITYSAYDQKLERRVAIKEYFPSGLAYRRDDGATIHPRTSREGQAYEYGLKRFLDEARTLAKFREPSIVRVTQFIEANDTAYLVMDYEEGQSLAEYLDAVSSIDEQQIREIMIPILQGLRAVHLKQYLHRDIKPANIFLRDEGPPVLLDFGAARQALEEQASALTILLTPGYASFEQYTRGEKQGPWSDLYGIGATMYHCLLGVAPAAATERVSALYDNEPDLVVEGLERARGHGSSVFIKVIEWLLKPMARDRPANAESVLNVLVPAKAPSNPRPVPATVPAPPAVSEAARARADLVDTNSDTQLTARKRLNCQPELVRMLESTLESYIGSLSPRVVRSAISKSSSYEELLAFLSGYILPEGDQKSFFAQAVELARVLPDGGVGLSEKAERARALVVDERLAKLAEAALAVFLGPIAKVLVKKASRQASSREEFFERLANELSDPREREQFQHHVEANGSAVED